MESSPRIKNPLTLIPRFVAEVTLALHSHWTQTFLTPDDPKRLWTDPVGHEENRNW